MCQPWFYNDNVFELSTNGKLHDQYVKIIQNFTEEVKTSKYLFIKYENKLTKILDYNLNYYNRHPLVNCGNG